MAKSTYNPQTLEPAHLGHLHLVCWKSVIFGVLISILTYMLLAALGAGLIGVAVEAAIENQKGGSALATGASIF